MIIIQCKVCNTKFTQPRKNSIFCSKKCKSKNIYNTTKKFIEEERVCLFCNCKFIAKRKNHKFCVKKCMVTYQNDKNSKKTSKLKLEKYKDLKNIPTCKTCGHQAITLHAHIIKFHKMSLGEYKLLYAVIDNDIYHKTYLDFLSKKATGDKNPGFKHGGKLSPFSKRFISYENLSNDEKNAHIQKIITKSNETRNINNSFNSRLEYYTLRCGLNEDQAKKKLRKRQQTFSLAICIEKYGEHEGTKKWLLRQKKWLATLDALPPEEKQRIYLKKINYIKRSYSFLSVELFSKFNIVDSYYGKNEYKIILKNKKIVFPDFLYGQKIIEFYGDFWHANPIKYKSDDILKHPRRGGVKFKIAQEIWLRDKRRISDMENNGYDVLIIWENEYKNNPEGTVEKCLKFLK